MRWWTLGGSATSRPFSTPSRIIAPDATAKGRRCMYACPQSTPPLCALAHRTWEQKVRAYANALVAHARPAAVAARGARCMRELLLRGSARCRARDTTALPALRLDRVEARDRAGRLGTWRRRRLRIHRALAGRLGPCFPRVVPLELAR